MHEYGLAADIARHVESEVERASAHRLAALEVEIGGLARFDADALHFWLRESLGEFHAATTRIRVLRASISLTCLRCAYRRTLVLDDNNLGTLDLAYRRCPQCQSDEVKLDGEAGCRIRALRFEC